VGSVGRAEIATKSEDAFFLRDSPRIVVMKNGKALTLSSAKGTDGYFERERRNSQKKPPENTAVVKSQANGLAKKPEFHPIGPVPTWYPTDR
jgi:hypothetical protein